MQMDPGYLDRKNEEIALIARALGGSRCPRIRTIEAAIEEKFASAPNSGLVHWLIQKVQGAG